jgi:hypothetical protein
LILRGIVGIVRLVAVSVRPVVRGIAGIVRLITVIVKPPVFFVINGDILEPKKAFVIG